MLLLTRDAGNAGAAILGGMGVEVRPKGRPRIPGERCVCTVAQRSAARSASSSSSSRTGAEGRRGRRGRRGCEMEARQARQGRLDRVRRRRSHLLKAVRGSYSASRARTEDVGHRRRPQWSTLANSAVFFGRLCREAALIPYTVIRHAAACRARQGSFHRRESERARDCDLFSGLSLLLLPPPSLSRSPCC